MSDSDSDTEPKLPIVGDIFSIHYAYTCVRFAIVEKITAKTVRFRIIGMTSKTLHGDPSYNTSIYKPLKDKKTDKTFNVHKKNFDEEGDANFNSKVIGMSACVSPYDPNQNGIENTRYY